MKVLHVVPSYFPATAYGGPVESVYALCRYLVGQDCTVRVLSTDANGLHQVLDIEKDREIILPGAVPVRYCHRVAHHSVSVELLRQLPDYVRWADLVHLTAVYSFPTVPTLMACKWLGKPLIWSPRGALQRWAGTSKRTRKRVFELLCLLAAPKNFTLHVTSEQEAEESAAAFPQANIAIVSNGIEIPAQCAPGQTHRPLRLLFLGRLDPKKGIENLLAACAQLRKTSRVDFTLTIAGAGDPFYECSLRERIEQLSLSDQVTMIGAISGVVKEQQLNSASVVVVPSHTENFAMVVAEALAHGVPVISSRGTPWARLGEVGCGLWVDNDAASLAVAIEKIAAMPIADMGQRGRRWMEQEFSWEERAKSMTRVYQELQVGRSRMAMPLVEQA